MTAVNTVPYYGMFSDEGNMAVHGIVVVAKSAKLSWADIYKSLNDLARGNPDTLGEAMDTMVREIVYDTVGCTGDFYI
jgi:DNA-binding phage protein